MPIYEYKCENGHVFDVMQKLSEDPLSSCVECGAPVRKVLHPVSISFKGSGFYSTDYGEKGPKEAAQKDTSKSATGHARKRRRARRSQPSPLPAQEKRTEPVARGAGLPQSRDRQEGILRRALRA